MYVQLGEQMIKYLYLADAQDHVLIKTQSPASSLYSVPLTNVQSALYSSVHVHPMPTWKYIVHRNSYTVYTVQYTVL